MERSSPSDAHLTAQSKIAAYRADIGVWKHVVPIGIKEQASGLFEFPKPFHSPR